LRLLNSQRRSSQLKCWGILLVLVLALSPLTARADHQPLLTDTESAESAPVASPSGSIPTRDGFQLTLQSECADIQIFTDAANEVTYAVRLDDAATQDRAAILRKFALSARQTPKGVLLVPAGQTNCRRWVLYEIHMPHRYSLNVAVQAGAITVQSIEGRVELSTGGGDIRLGTVAAPDPGAETRNARFAARLQTGGGDIAVGDILGGLRASTGGGQITTGDIRGAAVLRTGGGDIRVGHIFGPARFWTGGGNIIAHKIDGGIWAETDGGRVQIGNAIPAVLSPQDPSWEDSSTVNLSPVPGHENPALMLARIGDIGAVARMFDAFVWGGIQVAPAEEEQHLIRSVAPNYPEVARLAGIEGDVTLRILVGEDGTIEDARPISGPPVLARSAIRAVEQWRYAPALVNGQPVDVVTTVTFSFRLR
jgi:TonB family protein